MLQRHPLYKMQLSMTQRGMLGESPSKTTSTLATEKKAIDSERETLKTFASPETTGQAKNQKLQLNKIKRQANGN